ncbi:MAG: VOC family protein [Gemmatimonadetes bacterium]|nr:VOC family protein [Gemmatimonadota bacterium]
MPRLLQIAAKSADLDRSARFYRDTLGLAVIAQFDPPGLLFIDLGATRLLLENGAKPAVLYLQVEDLESACTSLRTKNVNLTSEPHRVHKDDDGLFGDKGVEEWMAFLNDPDGNTLALVERRHI